MASALQAPAAILRHHHERLSSISSASVNQLQTSPPNLPARSRVWRCAASIGANVSSRDRKSMQALSMAQLSRKGCRSLRAGAVCAASSQQEAEPDASCDSADFSTLEADAALPSKPLGGRRQRTPLLSTLEEQESIDALESVQSTEALIEDRGEFVFLLVGAAIAFGAGVWAVMGPEKGAEYFAGYLLEQSLSVDNLFVFILVFKYLQVPREDQNKVLTYGLLSAAVLRGVMILLGVELIENFDVVLLGFAGILLFSSYKLLATGDEDEDEDLSDNFIVKFCRRFMNVSDHYSGDRFFTEVNGVRMATPLLLALAVVELSDVVFAVDSVPAVFGVTKDPFIIYSSNLFAIVSLRALYGFVATVMAELRFLNKAVAIVLGFVGLKMVVEFTGVDISTQLSLGVVASVLAGGVGLSLWLPVAASMDEEDK